MRISLIAAVADNGVIGDGNDIPWHLPEDFRHFKRTTMGHHLVMGRRTWDSIGRALPGRTTIVISRGRPELPDGVLLRDSLEAALETARGRGEDEVFIAGGAEIYRHALPLADRLHLTRVRASPGGDTHFPEWNEADWKLLSEERHETDDRHEAAYDFQVFDRVRR